MADTSKITFRVWFVVRENGQIQMLDSADAAMNCHEDEEWFGPYKISIPAPERILMKLRELGHPIEGTVTHG